jgi:hypothetical protein
MGTMRLPNGERAIVRIEKLTEYSLNPWHEAGKHKARVFKAALGITIDDADWLRQKILESVPQAEALPGRLSAFGQKYVVDIIVERNRKSALVRTAWIIDRGSEFPRLTSCYIL